MLTEPACSFAARYLCKLVAGWFHTFESQKTTLPSDALEKFVSGKTSCRWGVTHRLLRRRDLKLVLLVGKDEKKVDLILLEARRLFLLELKVVLEITNLDGRRSSLDGIFDRLARHLGVEVRDDVLEARALRKRRVRRVVVLHVLGRERVPGHSVRGKLVVVRSLRAGEGGLCGDQLLLRGRDGGRELDDRGGHRRVLGLKDELLAVEVLDALWTVGKAVRTGEDDE